jgi:hypothetical protein
MDFNDVLYYIRNCINFARWSASAWVFDLLNNAYFIGLAGDLKKAMKDGKPIIIEVRLIFHFYAGCQLDCTIKTSSQHLFLCC